MVFNVLLLCFFTVMAKFQTCDGVYCVMAKLQICDGVYCVMTRLET